MQTPDPRNHHDWQSFAYIHCKLSVMLEGKGGVGGGAYHQYFSTCERDHGYLYIHGGGEMKEGN